MIHSSLSTGHKHVGHLKKKSKHTHTHFVSLQSLHAPSKTHASVILKPWSFRRQQRKWKRCIRGEEWEHRGLRREKRKRRNTSSLATAGSKQKHQVSELYKTEKCCNTERFWTCLSYLSRDEQKPTTKKPPPITKTSHTAGTCFVKTSNFRY